MPGLPASALKSACDRQRAAPFGKFPPTRPAVCRFFLPPRNFHGLRLQKIFGKATDVLRIAYFFRRYDAKFRKNAGTRRRYSFNLTLTAALWNGKLAPLKPQRFYLKTEHINKGVDGEKYRGKSVKVSRRQWEACTRVRAKNTPELRSERGDTCQ